MNFESLVGHINQVQDVLQAQAAHAVNLSLTSRNWLVGYYIVKQGPVPMFSFVSTAEKDFVFQINYY